MHTVLECHPTASISLTLYLVMQYVMLHNCNTKPRRGITALVAHTRSDSSQASSFVTMLCLQGGGSVNYWVCAVDARNREYAQLMRKFQVETNLHDATKRSLSEQLHDKQTLQVSCTGRSRTYCEVLSHCSSLHCQHVSRLRSNEAIVVTLVVMWRLDCTPNVAELRCVFSQLGSCKLLLTRGQKLLSKGLALWGSGRGRG